MVGFAREVPDFVHVLNDVAPIDSFFQFGDEPGAHQTALGLGMNATVTAFGQWFGLLVFHVSSTEGKREFSTVAIG